MALQDKVEELSTNTTRLLTRVDAIDKQLEVLKAVVADLAVLKQQVADLKSAQQEMREELKALASHDRRIALVEHQLAELKNEHKGKSQWGRSFLTSLLVALIS